MVFGALLGIPPSLSLSLSLVVRVREIITSVPAFSFGKRSKVKASYVSLGRKHHRCIQPSH